MDDLIRRSDLEKIAERLDCPMRHPDNGNCLAAGGFCTAVNDSICEALHNAYYCGKRAPTINPESLRPVGYWIHDVNNLYACSECLERETMSPKKKKPFCPNCGARMKGVGDGNV